MECCKILEKNVDPILILASNFLCYETEIEAIPVILRFFLNHVFVGYEKI